jgi:hypothetical protein
VARRAEAAVDEETDWDVEEEAASARRLATDVDDKADRESNNANAKQPVRVPAKSAVGVSGPAGARISKVSSVESSGPPNSTATNATTMSSAKLSKANSNESYNSVPASISSNRDRDRDREREKERERVLRRPDSMVPEAT